MKNRLPRKLKKWMKKQPLIYQMTHWQKYDKLTYSKLNLLLGLPEPNFPITQFTKGL